MADKDNMNDLDVLFAAARHETSSLSPDLTDRILQDAMAVQSGAFDKPSTPVRGPGLWQQLVSALGGWPAMSGFVAASAAGIWIGVAPPEFFPDPVAMVSSTTETDLNLLDSYDMSSLWAEDQ